MLELFGKKYFHIFTVGDYPQGNLSLIDITELAAFYSVGYHEACIWEGHPIDYKTSEPKNNKEPKALGWIKSLLVMSDKLYAEFWDLSDDLIELLEQKKYKYCSIEVVIYEDPQLNNGRQTKYLYALGLTNRPAVTGLEPLTLGSQYTDRHINNNYMGARLTYELINTSFNLNKNTMNQILIDIAKSMGIDVTKFTEDKPLADAIKKSYSDNAAKIITFTSELASLKDEVASLKNPGAPAPPKPVDAKSPEAERIDTLEAMLYTNMVDDAIKAGKVIPAQRESMIAFAKSNYNECRKLIDVTPVNSVFADKTVKDAAPVTVDLTNPKFMMNGKRLTYSEVILKPELLAQFTDADLEALKQAK